MLPSLGRLPIRLKAHIQNTERRPWERVTERHAPADLTKWVVEFGLNLYFGHLQWQPLPPVGVCPTHASVEIANGATLEDLLPRFGHTDGPDVLRSNYVGRMGKKDAVAILSIGPNGRTIPLLKSA